MPRPTSACTRRAQVHARREEEAGERDERGGAQHDLEPGLVLERGRALGEERPRDEAREGDAEHGGACRARGRRRLEGVRHARHCAESPGGGGRYPREREAGAPTPDARRARVARAPRGRGGGRLPADLRRLQGRRPARRLLPAGPAPQRRPVDPARHRAVRARASATRSSSAQTQCGSAVGSPRRSPRRTRSRRSSPPARPGAAASRRRRRSREPPAPKVAPIAVSTELAAPQLVPAAAAVSSDTPGALIALLVAAGIAVLLALALDARVVHGLEPRASHEARFCGVSECVGPRSARPLARSVAYRSV